MILSESGCEEKKKKRSCQGPVVLSEFICRTVTLFTGSQALVRCVWVPLAHTDPPTGAQSW